MPRVMRVVRAPDSLEHTHELIAHRQRRHFIFVSLVKCLDGLPILLNCFSYIALDRSESPTEYRRKWRSHIRS